MDIDAGDILIRGVENTDDVHNVVVCTLCSCYPRSLIGLPPDWYKSRAYRSRTVQEPRKFWPNSVPICRMILMSAFTIAPPISDPRDPETPGGTTT